MLLRLGRNESGNESASHCQIVSLDGLDKRRGISIIPQALRLAIAALTQLGRVFCCSSGLMFRSSKRCPVRLDLYRVSPC